MSTISDADTAPNYFASLRHEEFMVLTTFRASGEPVPTTVWFAETDGRIYITTLVNLKKVGRIQKNPKVQVIPSDRIGNTHGMLLEAQARVLEPTEFPRAQFALQEKYGEPYVILTGQMDTQYPPDSRTFIEITPPTSHVSM
ncbi:MAG: PPOX class F420-dependent oxidoreductase [Chloroflexi bacterium AL-W]|nr:PPOX class F420-dependent oxidoreductase [Chloroflexi bacterium AL-N1]NOK69973.1 PPOX class F420-dependent oxidoreductase [Chloroflexi bacterium AL-N10]NOK73729.1 PPOX class F420-dependent oxidoreductase [Chloroflexi bacterium AL-N5]NOK85505.1 PPOX class F420-dependent oxidoreductase [Chloroflexi bacterium AL-W]NOK91706.1 PPOX class F420-dependent oxidoreductase [Chloroflexi bacterium AL-N15]